MRLDDEIIDAYRGNDHLSPEECRRLYEIVEDPWNLGSHHNYRSYGYLIDHLDRYIDWHAIDWIIDFGSGIGAFTKALKDRHGHIKSLGIDFDTAHQAAENRFGGSIFDHQINLGASASEYHLLKQELPSLHMEQPCLCFINSTYYLFKDIKKRKRVRALARLIRHFESMAENRSAKHLMVSSGFTDHGAVAALNRMNREILYFSRELALDNENPEFRAELHTSVWQVPE